jgi:hypothetical protein
MRYPSIPACAAPGGTLLLLLLTLLRGPMPLLLLLLHLASLLPAIKQV